MKKLATILLLFPVMAFSQGNTVPSVAISYSFLLLEDPSLAEVNYVYQPGQSAAFSKLYYPEMKKYSEAFLEHVKQMRSVKNYIGPLGTGTPTSLGDLDFRAAISKTKKGELEKIGNLYFDPEAFDAAVTFDGAEIRDKKNGVRIVDEDLVTGPDTVYTENLRTGEMEPEIISLEEDIYKKLSGAGFIEEWSFEKTKGVFNKEIKYLSSLRAVFDEQSGDYRGLKPVFAFKAGTFNKRNVGELRLVRENIEYNVLFNRDFNIALEGGESDGMVLTSDAGGYIEPSIRYQFLISLLDAVNTGQLVIYDYDGIKFNIKKAEKVTRDEFFDRLSTKDTVYVENLMNGEMEPIIIEMKTQLSDVIGIRFFEDWYMDYANMSMYKRVNGIVLLCEKRDELTGAAKGSAPVNNAYIQFNTKM
jgi:hypothetical protein